MAERYVLICVKDSEQRVTAHTESLILIICVIYPTSLKWRIMCINSLDLTLLKYHSAFGKVQEERFHVFPL